MFCRCLICRLEADKKQTRHILKHSRHIKKLVKVFEVADPELKTVAPLLKIIKASRVISRQVAHTEFIGLLLQKLQLRGVKAEVKTPLMQMLQVLFRRSRHQKELIEHFGLVESVTAISTDNESSRIVLKIAEELLSSFKNAAQTSISPSPISSLSSHGSMPSVGSAPNSPSSRSGSQRKRANSSSSLPMIHTVFTQPPPSTLSRTNSPPPQ